MKIYFKFIILFITSITLSSCEQNSKNYKEGVYFKLNVPIIYQLDDYSCSTTSAAMIISYFSNEILDKDKAWNISGLNIADIKNYGNDMDGLKNISDFYSYESVFKESLSIHDLEQLISNGIPVIINVLQKENLQQTHAVVVIGYDKKKKTFFINDPAKSIIGNEISYENLNDLWLASIKGLGAEKYHMSYRSGFIIYPKN